MEFEKAVKNFRSAVNFHKPASTESRIFSIRKRENAWSEIVPVCEITASGEVVASADGSNACEKAIDDFVELMEEAY